MPDLAKVNNFVSRARGISPEFLDLLATLDGLSSEWFANEYNSGGANEITDADLIGENQAITASQLQQLMFTIDTARTTIDGSHRSNLQIARP